MTSFHKTYSDIYPPKGLSREAFHKLVTFLKTFKAELEPSKRSIHAAVFGDGLNASKENGEVDALLAPLVLEEIREVKFILEWYKDKQNYCESFIFFGPESISVSTNDWGTDWGAAIQADLNRYLRTEKIVGRFFWARLNGLLKILMYPFLILAGVYYTLWHFEKNTAFLISMCGFLFAGLLLLAKDIHQHFVPRPFQAIPVEKRGKHISIQLWVTILSLLAALLGIAKELIRLLK